MSEWRPCGYGCGKPWRPWAGSRLIGHAKCAIPVEEQDALLIEVELGVSTTEPEPGRLVVRPIGLREIAARYGVTLAVFRTWLGAALRRRSLRAGT